jgi:hypothetical protein
MGGAAMKSAAALGVARQDGGIRIAERRKEKLQEQIISGPEKTVQTTDNAISIENLECG